MRLARPPLSTLRACAVYAVRRCVLNCRGSGKKVRTCKSGRFVTDLEWRAKDGGRGHAHGTPNGA